MNITQRSQSLCAFVEVVGGISDPERGVGWLPAVLLCCSLLGLEQERVGVFLAEPTCCYVPANIKLCHAEGPHRASIQALCCQHKGELTPWEGGAVEAPYLPTQVIARSQ